MNVINVSSQIQYMCIEESCSYSFVQIIALNVIHYGNIHVHVTLKSVCNCASICTNDLSHSMYGRQVPASNGTNRAGKCSLNLDNCTPDGLPANFVFTTARAPKLISNYKKMVWEKYRKF